MGDVREKVDGQLFTRGVENTNMADCISSLKTLENTSEDDIQGSVSLQSLRPWYFLNIEKIEKLVPDIIAEGGDDPEGGSGGHRRTPVLYAAAAGADHQRQARRLPKQGVLGHQSSLLKSTENGAAFGICAMKSFEGRRHSFLLGFFNVTLSCWLSALLFHHVFSQYHVWSSQQYVGSNFLHSASCHAVSCCFSCRPLHGMKTVQ